MLEAISYVKWEGKEWLDTGVMIVEFVFEHTKKNVSSKTKQNSMNTSPSRSEIQKAELSMFDSRMPSDAPPVKESNARHALNAVQTDQDFSRTELEAIKKDLVPYFGENRIRRCPYVVWLRALCTVQVRTWTFSSAHGLFVLANG